ncbi:MAG: C4-dicarboxylate ABC transporter [Gemmatimonadetes bacterium]|nr:C4-dicarboxylate ABC transporter [Gemmatimonadota bacterium]
MTAGWWSLAALVVAIGLSMATRLNIGVVAIGFAWLIGTFVAQWPADQIVAGFPSSLFLTLTGVTLLFAIAETNGTLSALSVRALRPLGRSQTLFPWALFLLAGLVSSLGPGAIISVALIVPMAMAMGGSIGAPPFLTALMVANGANAGAMSPLSSVGIIANSRMAEVGLGGHEGTVWLANFAAHLLVSIAGYALFRRPAANAPADPPTSEPLSRAQLVTIAGILAWVIGAVGFKLNVGLSAFAAAGILIAFRSADEAAALRRIPWGVIVMVTGVSVLISVLERTGGMDLFSAGLSRLATAETINGVVAFVTGLVSSYSSTSGVVLPAFLPTAPDLVARLGGGDPLAVALSINVGSSLVDVSPLSTLGALCVATQADATDARRLFRQLLAWGLSMTVAGAVFSQLLAGWLARS